MIKDLQFAEKHGVLRVLLVDPSPTDTKQVRALLQRDGDFRIHSAREISEAETLLDTGDYDAALVDSHLWNEQGARLIQCVRERHPDVAIVLLTNGEDEREALPALKLGAHDFLSKQHLGDGSQLSARILAAVDESRALRRRDTMVRWLEREARTDHLTGLFNRRAFDEHLREVCDAARRENAPVALIVIDVAGTRMVNEAHGHAAGDSMIRRASSGIARCIRGRDFAARIGGDDFGIILPDGDLDLARRVARRIAHEIERLNTEEWDSQVPVAVTFGVATGVGVEPGDLFAAADQQLSEYKSIRPVIRAFRPAEHSDGPSVA
jgi:two-component system cell cycle response regulator